MSTLQDFIWIEDRIASLNCLLSMSLVNWNVFCIRFALIEFHLNTTQLTVVLLNCVHWIQWTNKFYCIGFWQLLPSLSNRSVSYQIHWISLFAHISSSEFWAPISTTHLKQVQTWICRLDTKWFLQSCTSLLAQSLLIVNGKTFRCLFVSAGFAQCSFSRMCARLSLRNKVHTRLSALKDEFIS